MSTWHIEDSPMTVRDEFALAALPAVIATCKYQGDALASRSIGCGSGMVVSAVYEIADAMMAARNKETT